MHIAVILFLNNLFSSDMLVILFIGLLLFGGDKLPEIARGLGKGIRDFKDASEGIKREINEQINSYERKEDKKTENAIVLNQAGQENQPAKPDHLLEGHQPVQNTVPVNDSHLFVNENPETESNPGPKAEQVADHHSGVPYIDSETAASEPIKNS